MSPTGHLAVGFAAKKYAPQIPLLAFLIAAYAIDLLYFLFLAVGIDTFEYNPWSHSLFMAVIWSLAAGLITFLISRKFQSCLVIGIVVFSHWILDLIVWDNMLLFFDQTQRIGLGLYNRIGFSLTGMKLNSGTVLAASIELIMLLIGVIIYFLFLKKSRKEKKENAFNQTSSNKS